MFTTIEECFVHKTSDSVSRKSQEDTAIKRRGQAGVRKTARKTRPQINLHVEGGQGHPQQCRRSRCGRGARKALPAGVRKRRGKMRTSKLTKRGFPKRRETRGRNTARKAPAPCRRSPTSWGGRRHRPPAWDLPTMLRRSARHKVLPLCCGENLTLMYSVSGDQPKSGTLKWRH